MRKVVPRPQFTIRINKATCLLYDAINGGQAKPSSLANVFGGEERLENLGHHLLAHAGTGVCHLNQHVIRCGACHDK